MKKLIAALAVAIAAVMTFSSTSLATGFRLPEQNSAAMGMASAFVGQADNPSAVWYNPAAITELDGTQISGGVIGIYPVLTHENTDGTTDVSDREIHIPFHLYATHKMTDNMAFGFGINNPFGMATDWDPNSLTKYIATYSQVVTTEFNPNIAFRLNDTTSVSFGLAYVYLRATMEKLLAFGPLGSPNFRLSGDGDGWGANTAILYKATSKLNIGISYRSRIKISVEGTAAADIPALTGFGLTNPGTNSAHTEIVLPDLIQIGSSYKVSENLTLNADLDYTLWSTYDRVVITSPTILHLTTAEAAISGSGSPTDTSTEEKQWHDVWCLRLGGQYKLSDHWKLRAGYLYDKNPVGESRFETTNPDSDRQGISIGTGYSAGNISVDLAYMYVRFNNRKIDDSLADADSNVLNGTYKSMAHMGGITIGYKF